jgi:hypothetical protein
MACDKWAKLTSECMRLTLAFRLVWGGNTHRESDRAEGEECTHQHRGTHLPKAILLQHPPEVHSSP